MTEATEAKDTQAHEQQRTAIKQAAMDLMTADGGRKGLEEIAKHAGVTHDEAKAHFDSAEHVATEYLGDLFERVDETIRAAEGYGTWGLHAKMRKYFEGVLEELEAHREALGAFGRSLGLKSMFRRDEVLTMRRRLGAVVNAYFLEAVEAGELPSMPAPSVGRSLAEYSTVLVTFWLTDKSEGYAHTKNFLNHSLGLALGAATAGSHVMGMLPLLRRQLQSVVMNVAGVAGGPGADSGQPSPSKSIRYR